MGRRKGSKNRPKEKTPEELAARKYAEDHGFVFTPEPVPKVVPFPASFRDALPYLKVKSKRGAKVVPLVLNDEQEQLLDAWEAGDPERIAALLAAGDTADTKAKAHQLVLKPRKIGITTFFAALFFHKWMTCPDPITLVHLANKKATSGEIMKMHRTFLRNLPEEYRPKLTLDQSHLIEREGGATIVCAPANARGGGLRGYTPYWLHISEINFCPDPGEIKAATLTAVPLEEGGRIVLESTANYIGDPIHEELTASEAGTSEVAWQIFFFPWHEHQSYRSPAPGLVPTLEELDLIRLYSLDIEQIAWRRAQIGLIGAKAFMREFPASQAEAYANLAGQWFTDAQLADVALWTWKGEGTVYAAEHDERERYAAGADCASGHPQGI